MSNQLEVVSKDKVQLIKDQICKGASDQELEMFIMNCNRTGLDPFQKQCWAIKRWDSSLGREVITFQTGVDGFRVIANRSEKYSGQLGPYWCGEDGVWKDVWVDSKPPIASKVAVLRADFKEPMWAVAKLSSYMARKKDGSPTPFWAKMPELMIAKVAECLALRKAFPQDLSGIYSQEEMEQAENPVKDVTPKKMTEELKDIFDLPKDDFPKEKIKEAAPKPIVKPPVINHAIQKPKENIGWPKDEVSWKDYKTTFRWGSFPEGMTFQKLGPKDTQSLINGIKSFKLKKESQGEKIFPQCEEFIIIANQYLESLK